MKSRWNWVFANAWISRSSVHRRTWGVVGRLGNAPKQVDTVLYNPPQGPLVKNSSTSTCQEHPFPHPQIATSNLPLLSLALLIPHQTIAQTPPNAAIALTTTATTNALLTAE